MTEPVALLRVPFYDRQEGESRQAFAAFSIYRDMGPGRSQDAAYRSARGSAVSPAQGRSGRWHEWGTHWRWTDRAAAWDEHLDKEQRSAQEAAARVDGERIADERRAQRARELTIGNRLLQRAEEMLQLPIIEVVTERDTETGKVSQTIKPGKWRFGDIPTVVKVGVELRRLALEMETSRASIRIDIEDELRRMARENNWDEDATVEAARMFADERGDRAG